MEYVGLSFAAESVMRIVRTRMSFKIKPTTLAGSNFLGDSAVCWSVVKYLRASFPAESLIRFVKTKMSFKPNQHPNNPCWVKFFG